MSEHLVPHSYNTRQLGFRHPALVCEVERRALSHQLILLYESIPRSILDMNFRASLRMFKRSLMDTQWFWVFFKWIFILYSEGILSLKIRKGWFFIGLVLSVFLLYIIVLGVLLFLNLGNFIVNILLLFVYRLLWSIYCSFLIEMINIF